MIVRIVKSVYKAHVGAGNQVAVSVDRDLDGAVSHLFFDVDNRGSVLEKLRSEGMTQIVKANLANAGLRQHGEEFGGKQAQTATFKPPNEHNSVSDR